MNTHRTALIKEAQDKDSPFWKRVANDLQKSNRSRRVVNLSRINRSTEAGETVVVPGKVLGDGDLDHELTIAAYNYSSSALEKLDDAGCTVLTIDEFLEKHPDGAGRIIG